MVSWRLAMRKNMKSYKKFFGNLIVIALVIASCFGIYEFFGKKIESTEVATVQAGEEDLAGNSTPYKYVSLKGVNIGNRTIYKMYLATARNDSSTDFSNVGYCAGAGKNMMGIYSSDYTKVLYYYDIFSNFGGHQVFKDTSARNSYLWIVNHMVRLGTGISEEEQNFYKSALGSILNLDLFQYTDNQIFTAQQFAMWKFTVNKDDSRTIQTNRPEYELYEKLYNEALKHGNEEITGDGSVNIETDGSDFKQSTMDDGKCVVIGKFKINNPDKLFIKIDKNDLTPTWEDGTKFGTIVGIYEDRECTKEINDIYSQYDGDMYIKIDVKGYVEYAYELKSNGNFLEYYNTEGEMYFCSTDDGSVDDTQPLAFVKHIPKTISFNVQVPSIDITIKKNWEVLETSDYAGNSEIDNYRATFYIYRNETKNGVTKKIYLKNLDGTKKEVVVTGKEIKYISGLVYKSYQIEEIKIEKKIDGLWVEQDMNKYETNITCKYWQTYIASRHTSNI